MHGPSDASVQSRTSLRDRLLTWYVCYFDSDPLRFWALVVVIMGLVGWIMTPSDCLFDKYSEHTKR
jgi:hypothetical protein